MPHLLRRYPKASLALAAAALLGSATTWVLARHLFHRYYHAIRRRHEPTPEPA